MVGQGPVNNIAFGAHLVTIVVGALAVVFMIVILLLLLWVLSWFIAVAKSQAAEPEGGQTIQRVDSGIALSEKGNG